MKSGLLCTKSEDVRAAHQVTAAKLASDPGFAEALESAASEQRAAECSWLSASAGAGLPVCPVAEAFTAAQRRLSGAQPAENAGALFYTDPEKIAACFTISTEFYPAPPGAGTELDRRFAEVVAALRGVPGSAGAEDCIAELGLALKVSATDSASRDDMRHEAFVTMFGTNRLRRDLPNFPAVFAVLESPGAPAPDKRTARKALASPRRARAAAPPASAVEAGGMYLAVEDYTELQTVHDAIHAKTLTVSNFERVLFQVAVSLSEAGKTLGGFTHYNLSPQTVRLRESGGTAAAPAVASYGPRAVLAESVPVFTEFGFSHIAPENDEGRQVPFGFAARGRAALVEYGIFRDRAHPACDVYHFILTCAQTARAAGASDILEAAGKFVKYFNNAEPITDILDTQQETYYYLPITSVSRAYSLDAFANFMLPTASVPLKIQRGRARGEKTRFVPRGSHLTAAAQTVASTGFVPQPATVVGFKDAYSALEASHVNGDVLRAEPAGFTDRWSTRFSAEAGGLFAALQSAQAAARATTRRVRAMCEDGWADYSGLGGKRRVTQKDTAGVYQSLLRLQACASELDGLTALGSALKYVGGIYWHDVGRDKWPIELRRTLKYIEEREPEIAETLASASAAVSEEASVIEAVPMPVRRDAFSYLAATAARRVGKAANGNTAWLG